jgi:hypothetical protein
MPRATIKYLPGTHATDAQVTGAHRLRPKAGTGLPQSRPPAIRINRPVGIVPLASSLWHRPSSIVPLVVTPGAAGNGA